jgi:hypothetical protein
VEGTVVQAVARHRLPVARLDARSTRVREASDDVVLDVSLQAAASAKPTAPRLAQTKIRSDQLSTSERDVMADLFAVLENLVLRNELPPEPRHI